MKKTEKDVSRAADLNETLPEGLQTICTQYEPDESKSSLLSDTLDDTVWLEDAEEKVVTTVSAESVLGALIIREVVLMNSYNISVTKYVRFVNKIEKCILNLGQQFHVHDCKLLVV